MAGSAARIGVLAVQGDFLEHKQALRRLGVEAAEVRLPEQLEGLDGLIIPGGESTTMVHLVDAYGLREPLREKAASGMPVWGTCAGMILLAGSLVDSRPEPLRLMDMEVSRNAFGRQIDSFEEEVEFEGVDGPPVVAVFIRAPVVTRTGDAVRVLAMVSDGRSVAVRQGNLLATSFHPELTGDLRVHDLFLRMTKGLA